MSDKYYLGDDEEVTKEQFQEVRKKALEDFKFRIMCNESFPKIMPYDLKKAP
jgi:uncharacterized linocin/CFP29 family protein